MVKELQAPELLTIPKGLSAKRPIDALKELIDRFDRLPKVFHFDDVTLQDCLETPDHEYLSFSFKNVSFGPRRLARFGFQFATVNIPSGDFGSNPRLVFYETDSQSLFENWFEESSDEHGPKLELRFARPASMDLDVWSRIAPDDRELVMAIIAELPVFVQTVRDSQVTLGRSWEDWISLAESIHAWALLHHHPVDGDAFVDEVADDVRQADATSATARSSRRATPRNRATATPKKIPGRLSRGSRG